MFEALTLVKRAVHESKTRKPRGALFVAIVKRACADWGVKVREAPALGSGRLFMFSPYA